MINPLWCCNKLHMTAFSFRLHLLGLFQGFFSFKMVEATYSLFGSSKGAATFLQVCEVAWGFRVALRSSLWLLF